MTTKRPHRRRPTGDEVVDNSALFDGEAPDAYDLRELETPELFGGSTDAATVERVTRGRVSADWKRA